MKLNCVRIIAYFCVFILFFSRAMSDGVCQNEILADLFVADVFSDTLFTDINAELTGAFAGNGTWFDYDNDGDLDILCTGWNDTLYFTKIYSNEKGAFTDIEAPLKGLGTEQGVSWGDYDNDSDVDIAMIGRTDPQNNNIFTKIYMNDNGSYVDINAPLQALNGGSVTWVDFNNDGALDLFVCGSPNNGGSFSSKLYTNEDGSFIDANANFPGVWGSSASWGDYDSDGDKDLFLLGYGNLGVTVKLYRNDNAEFTDISVPFTPCNAGSSQWVDFDNDGDLDISYNGVAPGGIPITKLYRNNGSDIFIEVSTSIKPLCVSAIAWGDFDNDGDLDVAESGSEQFSGTNPTTKIYRNDDGIFTDIDVEITGVWFGSLAWGDYDKDGKLDLLITGGTNGNYDPVTKVYKNLASVINTLPSTPTNGAASPVWDQVEISWLDANDSQTPQNALTYNLRLGTMSGSGDIINPLAQGTGFRRVSEIGNNGYNNHRIIKNLLPGTYYWSVQTVDNAFAGSAFSTEQSFSIDLSGQQIDVGEQWNLISIPLIVSDYAKTSLFPTAISGAFAYEDGYFGYAVLENGKGYWLKFSSAQSIFLQGTGLTNDTIAVTAGWNLIGSLSTSIPVSSIGSIPGGIVTSNFFGYEGEYEVSSYLEAGKGYWVKMSQGGQLILNSSSISLGSNKIKIENRGELPPSPPELITPASVPEKYGLYQNFPNPFNPLTKIEYALPTAGFVLLKVYNLLGQEVVTLVNEMQDAGYRMVSFDAGGLPSGVYTYKITAGPFSAVKKLLLLK